MASVVVKEFTEDEVLVVRDYKDKIVMAHADCAGTGIRVTKNGADECTCEKVFEYARELMFARVPRAFWGVDSKLKPFDGFAGDLQIDSSVLVFGAPQGGKTTALAHMAKAAILQSFDVVYVKADELLTYLRKPDANQIMLDRVYGSDMVLIDDLEKFNRTDWALSQIEIVVKRILDRGNGLAASTSLTPAEKDKLFSGSLNAILEGFDHKLMTADFKQKKSMKLTGYFMESFVKEAISK